MGPFLLGFGAALGFAAWRADSKGAALIFVVLLVVSFLFGRRYAVATAVATAVAISNSNAESKAQALASAQVAVYLSQQVNGQESLPPAGAEREASVPVLSAVGTLQQGGASPEALEFVRTILERHAPNLPPVEVGYQVREGNAVEAVERDGSRLEECDGDPGQVLHR